MKQTIILLLGMLPLLGYAQPDPTLWKGTLRAQGMNIDILFQLTEGPDGWSCTMDVPLQGLDDFPASSVEAAGDSLRVEFSMIPAHYRGVFSRDGQAITGNWYQGGQAFPLNMQRTEQPITSSRPQEPRPPFPYESIEVTFPSHTDSTVVLAGTFTYPKQATAGYGVVLVSGSGPQDRNEELMGHKPFLVLSDYLTRHGIAVLRYDDRGVGASTGSRRTATVEDFAEDALGGLRYLARQEFITCEKIGVIGHSEGGMVAAILGARDATDFIVMMAGPGTELDELLIDQVLFMDQQAGFGKKAIEQDTAYAWALYRLVRESAGGDLDTNAMRALVEDYYRSSSNIRQQFPSLEAFMASQVGQVSSPWFRHFINFVPQDHLSKIKCPVLALNGGKDFQVPAEKNLRAIETALIQGPCVDFEIRQFPGLNHLFQPAETGHMDEYARIPVTIDQRVLETITIWILGR